MEKALKIAEMLEALCTNPNNGEVTFAVNPLMDVAVAIRDLADELGNVKLVANHYEFMSRHLGMIVKERQEMMKPISDAEIDGLAENCWYTDEDLEIFNYKKFAKLLEERHGIK